MPGDGGDPDQRAGALHLVAGGPQHPHCPRDTSGISRQTLLSPLPLSLLHWAQLGTRCWPMTAQTSVKHCHMCSHWLQQPQLPSFRTQQQFQLETEVTMGKIISSNQVTRVGRYCFLKHLYKTSRCRILRNACVILSQTLDSIASCKQRLPVMSFKAKMSCDWQEFYIFFPIQHTSSVILLTRDTKDLWHFSLSKRTLSFKSHFYNSTQ